MLKQLKPKEKSLHYIIANQAIILVSKLKKLNIESVLNNVTYYQHLVEALKPIAINVSNWEDPWPDIY